MFVDMLTKNKGDLRTLEKLSLKWSKKPRLIHQSRPF